MKMSMKNLIAAGACCAALFGCSGSTTGDEDGGTTADAAVTADAGPTGCTVSTDGGNGGANPCDSTQYCNETTGACVKRCDAPTAPTVCGTTDACNPDTGMCQLKCSATSCTGGAVCGPDGLCETACVNGPPGCIATTMICDDTTNSCATPDTAEAHCALAAMTTTPAIPNRATGGPLLFDPITVADDMRMAGLCTGTDKAYTVEFQYYDVEGNAVVPSTTNDGPIAVATATWKKDAAGVSYKGGNVTGGFDKLVAITAVTATSGTITLGYCYGTADTPTEMVITVKDAAGNVSNPMCASF